MQAILLSLAFALAAQTGERYPGTNSPPADSPAADAAADTAAAETAAEEPVASEPAAKATTEPAAAAPIDTDGPVSPIVIHADTPQPTLIGTEPTAVAPPANPQDQAAPLAGASRKQAPLRPAPSPPPRPPS